MVCTMHRRYIVFEGGRERKQIEKERERNAAIFKLNRKTLLICHTFVPWQVANLLRSYFAYESHKKATRKTNKHSEHTGTSAWDEETIALAHFWQANRSKFLWSTRRSHCTAVHCGSFHWNLKLVFPSCTGKWVPNESNNRNIKRCLQKWRYNLFDYWKREFSKSRFMSRMALDLRPAINCDE